MNPNYFIHGANLLMVVAYSVRDILWLRLFALAASLISIPYFVFQPTPLWAPLCWSILFVLINLVQSVRLLAERRPVKLTAEEKEVCRIFAELPPRKVLQILSLGYWINSECGQQLIQHDKSIDSISLIVRGKVQIARDNRPLAHLSAGNLVGSALLLSGVPADVDAFVVEPLRAVRWEVKALEQYLTANPETRIVMQRHLARDLAGKVGQLASH
jgi:CRP-like cAMP-binding protein